MEQRDVIVFICNLDDQYFPFLDVPLLKFRIVIILLPDQPKIVLPIAHTKKIKLPLPYYKKSSKLFLNQIFLKKNCLVDTLQDTNEITSLHLLYMPEIASMFIVS